MSDTPSLQSIVAKAINDDQVFTDTDGYRSIRLRSGDKLAEIAMTALREACTITTTAQLDALPVGSVIRDNEGDVLESYARTKNQANAWMAIGVPCRFLSDEIPLPATLLGMGVSDV